MEDDGRRRSPATSLWCSLWRLSIESSMWSMMLKSSESVADTWRAARTERVTRGLLVSRCCATTFSSSFHETDRTGGGDASRALSPPMLDGRPPPMLAGRGHGACVCTAALLAAAPPSPLVA